MMVVLVGLFIFSSLMSCSKSSDEVSEVQPENTEAVKVEENDFTESDEDLLKVDYKHFYDQLAPHGEWIEVTDEEIGVDLNNSTASGEKVHRKMSFAQLFGVNSAYAVDVDFGAFFVWKPAPNLAIGVTTDNATPVTAAYVPYTNGQWVYTDAGWYFQAPTPYEEVVHHYGRWAYSPAVGWVWVPGRVWSPAWVDWRQNDNYIAWSPLAPGIYITDNRIIEPVIYEDRYVIVENRYFIEPQIYRYKYDYKVNKNKIKVKEMYWVDGVTVVDHRVINRGPEISVIENVLGTQIPVTPINHVHTINAAGYKNNVIHTYSPEFREFKVEKYINKPVRKPVKFVSYSKKEKNPGKQESFDRGDNKDVKQKGNDNNKFNERKFRHSGEGDMLDKRKVREKKNEKKINDNFRNERKNKGNNDNNLKNERKNKGKNDNNIKNERKSKGKNDNNIKNEKKSKGKNKSNGMRNDVNRNDGNINKSGKNKESMNKGSRDNKSRDKSSDNRQKSKGNNDSKQKSKGKSKK